MSIEITDWLRRLGLEQYTATFHDNDIDAAVLPRLTADDLRELGIASIGHRRRLLDAIAALGAPALAANASGSPVETTITLEPRGDAERRQLTVMFCDLVDSTALAARLDPEDLREVIAAYHRAVAETVGHSTALSPKYMGDGVLVYFGYPAGARGRRRAPAVRAGLGLIGAVWSSWRSNPSQAASASGSPPGWWSSVILIGEGSAQEHRSSASAEASPPVCKPWPSRMLSSSPRARAGWSAISSSTAISAPSS